MSRRRFKRPAASRMGASEPAEDDEDFDFLWDAVCCQCQNKNVSLRNERLMVAPCGHKFCQTCVQLHLPKRGSKRCPAPGCTKPVARKALSTKPLELVAYESELRVRKRVSRIFNKPASAFDSVREYNDYLERAELYIMNLVDGVDVEATNAALEKYYSTNHASISEYESRRESEMDAMDAAVKRQRASAKAAREEAKKQEAERKQALLMEKAGIEAVAVGDADAHNVRVAEDIDPMTGAAVTAGGALGLDRGGVAMAFQAAATEQPRPKDGTTKQRRPRRQWPKPTPLEKELAALALGDSAVNADVVSRQDMELAQSLLLC